MNSSQTAEFKVIAAIQHAHLLGAGVTTRHFRNGVELEPIVDDQFYDFDLQQVRTVSPPRIIKAVSCDVHIHTGKCKRRFGGIYAYCQYFIDRNW